jgi:diguanylate cyclase (GGDEF)-like protein/PAS domain S-box-containing protein
VGVVKKEKDIEGLMEHAGRTMKDTLHIINLEDSQDDSDLIFATLTSEGIECRVVRAETREDFIAALKHCGYDLILADYSLPSFDGLSALHIAKELCPEIPFILISGAIGEESVAEVLKSGATDCILKDGLSRLAPAIKRALSEVEERRKRTEAERELHQYRKHLEKSVQERTAEVNRVNEQLRRELIEHKQVEEDLRQSEERYRSLFENMLDGLAYCRMLFHRNEPVDFIYLAVNKAFERLTGLKDVVGKKVTEAIPGISESYPELIETYGRVALTGRPERFEIFLEPLGAWLSVSVYSTKREYFTVIFDNISDRKRTEEELKELNKRLEELSITDGLTGLYNSRHFYSRVEEEMKRADRYGHPLSVLIADVDDFKHYNDTHGHPMGDSVLRDIASCLRKCMREQDLVARYGGEEFSIILPETDKDAAGRIAERIRKVVAAQPFPHQESQPGGNLTISLGVATFPRDAAEIRGLVGQADKALYRAKENGKNRVERA